MYELDDRLKVGWVGGGDDGIFKGSMMSEGKDDEEGNQRRMWGFRVDDQYGIIRYPALIVLL